MAVFTNPSVFGPNPLIPEDRRIFFTSSWYWAPSSPVSANPSAEMTTPLTPLRTQSCKTGGIKRGGM